MLDYLIQQLSLDSCATMVRFPQPHTVSGMFVMMVGVQPPLLPPPPSLLFTITDHPIQQPTTPLPHYSPSTKPSTPTISTVPSLSYGPGRCYGSE